MSHDFDGPKYVTQRSYVPVMADESVFSPRDALTIMQMGAATPTTLPMNARLYNALKIASAAEVWVECAIGRMLEAKITLTLPSIWPSANRLSLYLIDAFRLSKGTY